MSKPIGFMLKQITQMNQTRLNLLFTKFDLTATQTFILIYLFQARQVGQIVHQKDIERDMEISNPTVTGILNRLEHKDLIERLASPTDARAKTIRVTKKALELDIVLRKGFDENERQLVSCLKDEEQQQLQQLLEKVLQNMNEIF